MNCHAPRRAAASGEEAGTCCLHPRATVPRREEKAAVPASPLMVPDDAGLRVLTGGSDLRHEAFTDLRSDPATD